MNDNDQYAQWDAAYVLGALVGAERAEYEEHLAGCAACRAAVAELAGLPGLLGQLSPAEAIAVESDPGAVDGGDDVARYAGPFTDPRALPEPPPSLMPRLPEIGPVPRPWLAPMAAAAAALLIGGVGGYAVSASRDGVPGAGPSSTLAVGSSRLAFVPVSASPMTAVVDVVPTGQGTEVRVECQYAPATATGTGSGSATASSSTAPGTATGAAAGPSRTAFGRRRRELPRDPVRDLGRGRGRSRDAGQGLDRPVGTRHAPERGDLVAGRPDRVGRDPVGRHR